MPPMDPHILANQPMGVRHSLHFFVNEREFVVDDGRAFSTLAEFLRDHCRLTGTKVVCHEGDCGACSVLVGRRTLDGQRFQYQTIDACILFLFQLDQTHIVTIEALSQAGALTKVQAAMVEHHGSQCGFCTPGFIMAIHGMIENETAWGVESARGELSGNLCRCTGYKTILEACLSLDPARVERLAGLFPAAGMLTAFQPLGEQAVVIHAEAQSAFLPRTLQQALAWRQEFPEATVVAGATDYGVLRNHRRAPATSILGLCGVEELSKIELSATELETAAGATWDRIAEVIAPRVPEYHQLLMRFGSPQIRNMGTIGGNLASGSPIADAVPFHGVMQARIELGSVRGVRQLPLVEFYQGYRQTGLAPDELILKIITPLPQPGEYLRLYKISKRRDMDISTVTFALWLKPVDGQIADGRILMGGVGPTVLRLYEVEAYLRGKPMSEETFRQAGRLAKQQLRPLSDVRGTAEYRADLAENLMIKSYLEWTG
jgi:xanthine dehydrogenase small subunit